MDPENYEPEPLFADEGLPTGIDPDFDDSRDFDIPNHSFDESF